MIENLEQLNLVLADPGEFKRQIENAMDLIRVGKKFPDYKNKLMEKLLNTPNEFNRLVITIVEVIAIVEEFPKSKDQFLKKLLTDSEEFKRIITSAVTLVVMGRVFPENKALLIQKIFNNPEEFKRLIRDSDLELMGEEFPGNNTVFKQPNVQKALEGIKSLETAYTQAAVAGALSEGDKSKIIPDAVGCVFRLSLNAHFGIT